MNKENDVYNNKEDKFMNAVINQTRPCTVSESIIRSCKEVKKMREGKTPKRSLDDLFADIEKWKNEEDE